MAKNIANDSILIEPVRDAYQASGMTITELARALGWYCGRQRGHRIETMPDTQRVRRHLGLVKDKSGDRVPRVRKHMREKTALKFAKALDLDPRDLGL